LRSGFSGSAFPTSPVPVAGQRCYREDLKKEYVFNGENWVEVASSGAIAQEVTLARGTHAKLQDRLGVSMNPDGTLKTPATANVDEFKVSGFEPTYVSTNSFSVPGDMRAIFTENRRLKITQGAETIYPAVVSASYDDVTEKTTIAIDGITITNEIAAVDFSMVQNGLPLASETVAGAVELATPAEVLAGEDAERAVTPATLTAKILGTVSQLEGLPTGAIIERGSNDNGEYVRFADGTQICTKTHTANIAVATPWGSSTYISGSINLGGWAAVFVSAPNRTIDLVRGGSAAVMGMGEANAPTEAVAGSVQLLRGESLGSGPRTLTVTGIGRWY